MRTLADSVAVGVIGIVIGAILMPLGLIAISLRKKNMPIPKELTAVADETYQVPTYLVTFVLPFLFVDIQNIPALVAYAMFVIFVALILAKSDISIVNPGLLIGNYRMYDAVDSQGQSLTVIAIRTPRVSEYQEMFHLSGRVYLLKAQEKGE